MRTILILPTGMLIVGIILSGIVLDSNLPFLQNNDTTAEANLTPDEAISIALKDPSASVFVRQTQAFVNTDYKTGLWTIRFTDINLNTNYVQVKIDDLTQDIIDMETAADSINQESQFSNRDGIGSNPLDQQMIAEDIAIGGPSRGYGVTEDYFYVGYQEQVNAAGRAFQGIPALEAATNVTQIPALFEQLGLNREYDEWIRQAGVLGQMLPGAIGALSAGANVATQYGNYMDQIFAQNIGLWQTQEDIEAAKAEEQSSFIKQIMDIGGKAASFIPGPQQPYVAAGAWGVPFLNLGGGGTSTPTAAPSATSTQTALWPGASQGAFGLGAQGAGQQAISLMQPGAGAINRTAQPWWQTAFR